LQRTISTNNLRPSARLAEKRAIIAFSRDEITSDRLAANAIDPSSLDWPWLITAAEKHCVASTLAWRLLKNEAIRQFVPEESLERLKEIYDSALLDDKYRSSNTRDILDALSQAKIATAVLKGPGLAIYFPQPCLRYYADLDLFISEGDIAKARAVLASLGYGTSKPEAEANMEFYTFHWGAYRKKGIEDLFAGDKVSGSVPVGVIGVEIHAPRHLSFGPLGLLDMEEWLSLTQETDLCGTRARILPKEEALIYACNHAANHYSSDIRKLSLLLDIHLLIQAGIDWPRFVESLKAYEAAVLAITGWLETEYLAGRLETSDCDMAIWKNFSIAQTVHYILEFVNAVYGTVIPFDLIAKTHSINSNGVDELCDGLGRRFLWRVPYWQRLMDFQLANSLSYDRLTIIEVLETLPQDDSPHRRAFVNDLDFWRRAPRLRPDNLPRRDGEETVARRQGS